MAAEKHIYMFDTVVGGLQEQAQEQEAGDRPEHRVDLPGRRQRDHGRKPDVHLAVAGAAAVRLHAALDRR